jgi:hypothetical protein
MARTRRRTPVPSGLGWDPSRRFTLRDIALKTAVPPRLLQFWTDSRLILPEGAAENPGRGTARLFSGIELQVAALLGPLAISGDVPIGRLKSFAYILRGALDGSAPPRQRMAGGAIIDYAEIRRVLNRARRGEGANFFVHSSFPGGLRLVTTVTDEQGPPKLDLTKFFQQPEIIDPTEFPRGYAMTIVLSLERLATLFD